MNAIIDNVGIKLLSNEAKARNFLKKILESEEKHEQGFFPESEKEEEVVVVRISANMKISGREIPGPDFNCEDNEQEVELANVEY